MWWLPYDALVVFSVVGLAACTENLPHGGTFREPRPAPTSPPAASAAERIWPVRGTIVSPFRPWTRPGHQGVDLAAVPGMPVVAAADGNVSYVGRIPGYGNVVAIEHADLQTTVYAHLADDTLVASGIPVAGGEVIGRIGENGYLHFEIRKGKEAMDPAAYYPEPPRSVEGLESADADVRGEPSLQVPIGAPTPVVSAEPTPAAPDVTEPVAEESVTIPPAAGSKVDEAATPRGAPSEQTPATDDDRTPAPGGVLGAAGGGEGANLAAGLLIANLLYLPPKLAYAAVGGIVGGLAYGLTGGAVTEVLEETLGGDYVIVPAHLQGERPIRFRGSGS